MRDVGPYTRVGRVADRENCTWASVIFERSGSIWVKKKTISKRSTILRGLAELRLVDQRCQTGLKLTLCGEASAMPFCQRLSRDFRYQALSRFFFLQVKKAERGLGTRLSKHDVRKMASARIEDYEITFRTFHWYIYCSIDVPGPSRFLCEGVVCDTRV